MSSDKRFPPSAKKLRKARENGDIARSRHLSGAVAIAIGALILLRCLVHLSYRGDGLLNVGNLNRESFPQDVWSVCLPWLQIAVEMLSGVVFLWIGIILSELIQTRGHLHSSIVRFDLMALSPLRGLKRLFQLEEEFSISGLVVSLLRSVVVSVLKLTAVALAMYLVCRELFWIAESPVGIAARLEEVIILLGGCGFVIVLVTAVVDLLWSVHRRNQRLMMDYNEMIQDLKESEGNQETKAMRRRAHQEILREADIHRVRSAKVLVTD